MVMEYWFLEVPSVKDPVRVAPVAAPAMDAGFQMTERLCPEVMVPTAPYAPPLMEIWMSPSTVKVAGEGLEGQVAVAVPFREEVLTSAGEAFGPLEGLKFRFANGDSMIV
jgi:hypothetical protein